jgi:hypothetical protein
MVEDKQPDQPQRRKETAMSAQVIPRTNYTLTLSGEERDGLLGLLQRAFGEVRVEMHRTHTPGFRKLVLDQETLIRGLIEKLERLRPDPVSLSLEAPVEHEEGSAGTDSLYIDEEGRFQMAAEDLEEFIRFLRDREVRVEVETADVFRSEGKAYGYGRLFHLFDADSVSQMYRTWKRALESQPVAASV